MRTKENTEQAWVTEIEKPITKITVKNKNHQVGTFIEITKYAKQQTLE